MWIKLTRTRFHRIAEIYMGIGHISLASLAIPALVDKIRTDVVIISLSLAIVFWVISILIEDDK